MSEIIRLENVVWMTQDNWREVNGISCRIQENDRVTFCGGSGSGKDALMRLIAGMEKPSSGSVFVLNQAVHAMSGNESGDFRNRYIGIVQPQSGFMEKISVSENISLPLIVRGINRNQSHKAAVDLMKLLGIHRVAYAYPAQLSNYETRAAGIARALITKPRILLLNDVLSCLLERDADKIIETISVIVGYGDFTMIWFSDSVNNRFNPNRTIQLHNGKIREEIK